MKKRNVFDLLALKEKINSNKYFQKIKSLSDEVDKVSKILKQLNELNETKNKESSMNAWELKSFASIQKKVHEQTSLAKNRLSSLQRDIKILEKSLSTHEIRRKRSIEKSNISRLNYLEDRENKIESDLPAIKRTTL